MSDTNEPETFETFICDNCGREIDEAEAEAYIDETILCPDCYLNAEEASRETTFTIFSPTEGWACPEGSKKWHYFREGMALCRKWMLIRGEYESEDFLDHSDNCASCNRRRRKELEKK